MNISELRKTTQVTRDNDSREEIWYGHLLRIFSIYFTRLFISIRLTPNQITFLSVITGVIAGVFFAVGSGIPSIIGSLILIFAVVLDCCDGEVARYRKMCSLTGLTFDMFAQLIVFAAAVFGISIACFRESGIIPGTIGFLTLSIYLLSSNLSLLKFSVAVEAMEGNEPSGKKMEHNNSDNGNSSSSGLRLIMIEFLKTPNQMLFFLFFSVIDALKIQRISLFNIEISYIAGYISFFFFVIIAIFLLKAFLIAKNLETDRLFSKLQ